VVPDKRRWVSPALAVITGLCFLPLTLYPIPSADLWWLLAEGRWIVAHGQLPTEDPFSYTAGNQIWHNDQWLCSLLAYALYLARGVLGLQVGKIALLCCTFSLAVGGARRAHQTRWISAVLAGLWCCSAASGNFFFDVRAYLWTYFFMVAWWCWLDSHEKTPLWWFGATAVLWSNLHAGVSGGLLLLGLAWIGKALQRRDNRRDAARLGVAFLGSLINPSGPQLLLHALRLLGSDWGRYLNEWQPIWSHPRLFYPYVLFLTMTLVLLPFQVKDWRRFPLLGIALLSITGWRHIPLFCWLAIGLWARWIDRVLPALPRSLITAVTLGWLGWSGWLLGQTSLAGLSLEDRMFPRWACDFLESNHLGPRLFHPYGVGGYLLFRLAPNYQVAIDGRAAQVYPVAAYLDYLRADQRPADFERFAREHHVQTVLTFANPRQREVGPQIIDKNPAWKRVYQDGQFNVYVPTSIDTSHLHHPDNPMNLCQQADEHPARALELVDEALRLEPGYASALFMKGSLLLRAGDSAGAGWIEKALAADPLLANAHLNLAIFYRQSDPKRARREALAELELDPGNETARRLFSELR
jgi:hypothetical protein